MGISAAKISSLVLKAFQKTGDLRTTVTFQRLTPGAYDPSTGAVAVTEVEYTVTNAVLTAISGMEFEWFPADRNTQKLLIAAEDLPVTPTTTDNVVIGGTTWEITRVKSVPGVSLYILYIMEP